jgi:hypothetical protein
MECQEFISPVFSCPNLLNEAYTAEIKPTIAAVAKVLSMTKLRIL